MNKVIIIGRITNDVILNTTKSGVNYLKFTVAVKRDMAINSETTDYIPVVIWRGLAASISRMAAKGSLVAVEGSLSSNRFVNSQNQNMTSYEVNGDKVTLLETRSITEQRKMNNQSWMGESKLINPFDPSAPELHFVETNQAFNANVEPSSTEQNDSSQNDEDEWTLDDLY
ncbi:single-stranded DNA-binding protein [Mycoplasma iguanae]|uniref:Single-stranded DNA-binding protein n=1 Tax=Mycoplasma iguanae TaxID=292461 RepID=A0ABY5R8Z1_9MOLU|nr:single-stranded DNA-binding protein [Mycoplasma iguanae]UVD81751.1 single-stranded DNA-binding protein [Mycoplasma iguanae]